MAKNNMPEVIPREWLILSTLQIPLVRLCELDKKVEKAYEEIAVLPNKEKIFRAFELCAPEDVRVVILGQDPYHTPGVADGLAFSTLAINAIPPSLRNIFKEISEEYGTQVRTNPDLSDWAKQGVLLLNTSLTVEAGIANSHADFGWHEFTDAVIKAISDQYEHIVFILWGNYAREKRALIDSAKHLVLESPHPSPLSAHRGFFGNDHFKKANAYLIQHGQDSIDWC